MIETIFPIGSGGIDQPLLAFIVILHALIGAALMLGVFWLVEYQLRIALVAGVVAAVGILLAEGWVGPRMFNITATQMRLLIQLAAGGGLTGATIVGTVFTPNVSE